MKGVYQGIAGPTAILTDVVAPWLEVVIVLLPDILTLLNGIFWESSAEQVQRRFTNNVVPQSCNKMYPQIRQNIMDSTLDVLDEYKNLLDHKLAELKAGIRTAEARKKEKYIEASHRFAEELHGPGGVGTA